MKKVKVFLTAITVLAVVGGALAFKANKFNTKKIWTSTQAGACSNEVLNKVLTTTSTSAKIYVTDAGAGAQCILTYTVTPDQN